MIDKCNICSNENFAILRSEVRDDATRKVCKCKKCGHVQLLPRPTLKDDREFYGNNLQDKNRSKEIDFDKMLANNLFDTNRHVELFCSLIADQSARTLDVGAGYGFFVKALRESGFKNVTGIEISAERRELGLENGVRGLVDLDVFDPKHDIGRFDVITCFHVLEHFADPVLFLTSIKQFLAANGVLIIEVPNADELLLQTCPAYNVFYWIRAHLNYFNATTLVKCIESAGFRDVEISYAQRYGILNNSNWLLYGKPQIEKPAFNISGEYQEVENYFRNWLVQQGKSDALLAVVRA